MIKMIAQTILFSSLVQVAWTQQAAVHPRDRHNPLAQIVNIVGIATANLPGRDMRVVIAAEASLQTISLRRWIVTVQPYPANYRVTPEVGGPPCMSELAIRESCSIQEISGQPLFRGSFNIRGQVDGFAGSRISTSQKILAFQGQLKEHPEWNDAAVIAALAAAGAKYGPDKKREFTAIIPLKQLARTFGPIKLQKISSLPADPNAWPAYWKINAILANDPKSHLIMYFDPYEGELQSLYISRPAKVWDAKARKFRWKYLENDFQ